MNQQLTVAEPGVLAVLNRSELDGALERADRRPRDLEKFESRALALATRDPETAAEMLYSVPRDGKFVEGPSVRLAEILVQQWGNCKVGARIIEEGQEFVVAQATFLDLETNATTQSELRRRIVTKTGRRYSADMIATTCNAACSIAMRTAVLRAIPKPYWEAIYNRAKAIATTGALPELRAQAIKAFQGYGIEESRILQTLGVDAVEKIDHEGIARLRGLFSALREGELTADAAFPRETAPAPASGAGAAAIKTLDEFAQAPLPGNQPAHDAGNSTAHAPEENRTPVSPGYSPPEESAADFYAAGQDARRKGAKKGQWPARLKDDPNAIEAWIAGWEAKDDEIRASLKGG